MSEGVPLLVMSATGVYREVCMMWSSVLGGSVELAVALSVIHKLLLFCSSFWRNW